MKKTTFYVALILLGSTSAIAQFSIGARVAGNMTNIEQSKNENLLVNTKNRMGIAFGLVAEVGVTEMFAIQPEVYYSQHGWRVDESRPDGMLKWKVRSNYIQIPLLAKLKFGSEAVDFNAFVGPHIGFGIDDLILELDGKSHSNSWKNAGYKTIDYGLTGGVGIAFAAGPGKLGVDIRYQLGIANIVHEPDDNQKASNRNLQIGLSYLLPIGN